MVVARLEHLGGEVELSALATHQGEIGADVGAGTEGEDGAAGQELEGGIGGQERSEEAVLVG